MNKSIAMGVLGLAILGTAVFASGVFASQGRMMDKFNPKCSSDRHTQMTEALANNDYVTWKSLMGDRGAAKVVTQENFSKFAQMHNLMLEGKVEQANEIRQELGLGNGQGRGMMKKRGEQNARGNFIDANNDGICDRMQ